MGSDTTGVKENKMGTMPIPRLLLSMSVPMIASMLIQALYNIVDSIFVAQISENALSAVSLAFPMQNFMIAVAAGTGVGVNALLSKSLGAKKFDTANKSANVSLFLIFINWLLFVIIGLTMTRPFLSAQTSVAEIVEIGDVYLQICLIGSFGLFGQVALERLLQSTGLAIYAMISQIIGAVVNIILDPIMIFGLFGFPAMGVAGAAFATVIGQSVGMFFGFYFNIKKNTDIHLDFRDILPNKDILTKIYAVGLPSILMISIGSIMVFGMNRILDGFTTTAIAVFGVYFKLQSFIFMPVFGMNNAMIPIISYNYGAKNRARIIETIRLSAIAATGLMLIGFLAFQLIPGRLLLLFDASEEMIAIGSIALRIISISFLAAGFNIVSGAVFQALGNGMYSLIVSVSRQLIALLPIAFLIATIFSDLDKVWLAYPLAEIVALTLTIIFLKRINTKKLNF